MPARKSNGRSVVALPGTMVLPTRWQDSGPRGSCPHCGAQDGRTDVITVGGKRERWCNLCVRYSPHMISEFVQAEETEA